MAERLTVVTVRELGKRPGAVLDRVVRGERVIVARHGRPIATLQPLDGLVVQPVSGRRCDVQGLPLGDADAEVAKLSRLERSLLVDAAKFDRIHPMRLAGDHPWGDIVRALEGFALRGLARKTSRGWALSGRGLVLRELLLRRAGRGEVLTGPMSGRARQLSLARGDRAT